MASSSWSSRARSGSARTTTAAAAPPRARRRVVVRVAGALVGHDHQALAFGQLGHRVERAGPRLVGARAPATSAGGQRHPGADGRPGQRRPTSSARRRAPASRPPRPPTGPRRARCGGSPSPRPSRTPPRTPSARTGTTTTSAGWRSSGRRAARTAAGRRRGSSGLSTRVRQRAGGRDREHPPHRAPCAWCPSARPAAARARTTACCGSPRRDSAFIAVSSGVGGSRRDGSMAVHLVAAIDQDHVDCTLFARP